jgi:hypothetical protein
VPSEKRTRVEFFLPIRTDASDYRTITEWLAEELAYSRGGSTLTSPFTGLYVSSTRGNVVRGDVHILFCDFHLDVGSAEDRAELDAYLDDVRSLLLEALKEEEVWIIYYQITRAVGLPQRSRGK